MMTSGGSKLKKSNCKRTLNPSLLIRKLVDLMEHPISKNATQRHLELLQEFLNASHYAFFLQDIPYIIRLYEMMAKRLQKIPQFKEPLECLLYFSAIPPMRIKMSDTLEYARDFQEYFSLLGYLVLCLPDEHLSKSVLNVIISLLKKKAVGHCCVSHEFIKEAVEKSKLPEILAQLLQVIKDSVYPLLLEAILLTCEISQFVCKTFAYENAIEFLLRRLEPTWHERNSDNKGTTQIVSDNIVHMENTCCILWKLLKAIEREEGNFPQPTIFAFLSLQYALRWSLIYPGHLKDRNNITGIILKIMDTFENVEFAEIELLHDLALLAMTATGQVRNPKMDFTQNDTDFQFKKIIWTTLHYFKGPSIHQIIEEHEIIKNVLKFLFGEQTGPVYHVQYCSLVKIVIKLIPKIVTYNVNDFLSHIGPFQITKMVKNYTITPYNIEILDTYIYCAHKCILLENEDITETFVEAGIFFAVTSVCNKILETKTLTKVHQKCLARCFCLLQIISEPDYANCYQLVDICICYLNRVIHPDENDPVLDVKLTVCALHLLWDWVSTVYSVHTYFVKKGGTYIILDIAEMCTFPIKSLTLGILADLSKRSICIPYLITWRKRGLKLLPMLMETFRGQTETSCYKTKKTEFSYEKIYNPRITLCRGQRTTFQNYCTTHPEILKSCRSKIHGILHALKVRYKDKVQNANKHYKLYSETMSPDDKLTMLFAENFLSLTLCQTWMDIAKELKNEGIVPVESDHELISDKIQRIRQWRSYLRFTIEYIVKKEIQQEVVDEYGIYMQLNEARLSDALDALKELRFVSNCTERMFQIGRKFRINQQVESRYQRSNNYHRTILNLPFTNIFNQTINIDSNTIFSTKQEIDIAPVSPNGSEPFEIEYSDGTLSERMLEC